MCKFENVTEDEIPLTILNNVKVRILNPLVNGDRLSNLFK